MRLSSGPAAGLIAALAGCGGAPIPLPTDGAGCDPTADLDRARAATERYLDPAVAASDGYLPQPTCDQDERGAAMGIHYVRIPESLDQALDLEAPDVLLYLPDGDGVALGGIEYVAPALVDGAPVFEPPADEATFDVAPELFCRPFDGPMEGHVAGQPWHHDLHVWLYVDNPDGLFAPYNPAADCG
ncbi:MAG: hypothetical protein ABMB14_22730 [Myxococcota bacterium]